MANGKELERKDSYWGGGWLLGARYSCLGGDIIPGKEE